MRFISFFGLAAGTSLNVSSHGISLDYNAALGTLLVCAASVLILKSFGFRGAPLVTVIAVITLISGYGNALLGVSDVFSELGAFSGLSEYVSAALKVVGISYLSGISSELCREIGEGGLAKAISTVTKLELVLLSLPYVKQILSSVLSLLDS